MSRATESLLLPVSRIPRRRLLGWMALGSVALSSGCAALKGNLQAPEVRVRDVTLGNLDLSGLEILVNLRLRNPNNVALPVTGIEYNLILENVKVADGREARAVTLPALGEADMQISLNVNLLTSATKLLPILLNPAKTPKSLHYKVDGHVKLDWWYLPSIAFDRSGELPLQIN